MAAAELSTVPLLRYGDDVFVVWDAEDAGTDLFLRTALTLARALCVRSSQQSAAQQADFKAIDAAILDIEKCIENLSKVEAAANSIQNGAETILNRVRIDRRSLEKQVATLREKLTDLRDISSEPSSAT
jgi:hypothetical protein